MESQPHIRNYPIITGKGQSDDEIRRLKEERDRIDQELRKATALLEKLVRAHSTPMPKRVVSDMLEMGT